MEESDELLSIEDKIRTQIDEINKTREMIDQFQECLSHQNQMLHKLEKMKEEIISDRKRRAEGTLGTRSSIEEGGRRSTQIEADLVDTDQRLIGESVCQQGATGDRVDVRNQYNLQPSQTNNSTYPSILGDPLDVTLEQSQNRCTKHYQNQSEIQDKTLEKEITDSNSIHQIDSLKRNKVKGINKIFMPQEDIPLPPYWNSNHPISNNISYLYSFPCKQQKYGNSFYRHMQKGFGFVLNFTLLQYPTPSTYPNRLIYHTMNKRLVVVKSNITKRFKVRDIMEMCQDDIPTITYQSDCKVMSLYIHAVSTTLTIGANSEMINIPKCKSIEVQIYKSQSTSENLNNIWISPVSQPSVFGVEFLLSDFVRNPFLDKSIIAFQTNATVNQRIINKRSSFLRKSLSIEEIQSKLRFLDGEFAVGVDEKYHAVSVALLDYNGKVLLNTLVKPRIRIADFQTRYHGIKDEDIVGQADEYEVIADIHRYLNGNILVGHNLQKEIKGFAIPIDSLLGIRDITAAKVFSNVIIDNKGDYYGLKELSRKLLGKHIYRIYHNALEDVRIVWEIYRKIEHQWEESISVSEVSDIFENVAHTVFSSGLSDFIRESQRFLSSGTSEKCTTDYIDVPKRRLIDNEKLAKNTHY